MPDLIRNPVFLFLDSCFRRNDEAEASFGECTQRDSRTLKMRKEIKHHRFPASVVSPTFLHISSVIPAKAGIKKAAENPGFRVAPAFAGDARNDDF
jgi:hypothetical protein